MGRSSSWAQSVLHAADRRASAYQSVVCGAAMMLGSLICWTLRQRVHFPDEQRYIFGYRSDPLTAQQIAAIQQAFWPQIYFTAGLVLIFGASAALTWRLALSRTGRRVGDVVILAVAVSAVFGLITQIAVLLGVTHRSNPIAATAAVITTCALIWALLSAPIALGIILIRTYSLSRSRLNERGHPWWLETLAQPALHDPGQPWTLEEFSWVNAYNVPGAQAVLDKRLQRREPVQSICLSGGGVRSASVAMGVLQKLSRAPALSGLQGFRQPGHDDEDTLIDSVDYIISVSGGGYTAGARLLCSQRPPGEKQIAGDEPIATARSDRTGRPLRLSERFEEGSVEFEHLRRHSSYLADSTPTLIRAFAEILKNLLASMITLFWPSVALGFVTGYFLAAFPVAAIVAVPPRGEDGKEIAEKTIAGTKDYLPSLVHNQASWWALAVFVVLGLVATSASLLVERASNAKVGERWRSRLTRGGQACFVIAAWIATVTVAAPLLLRVCSHQALTKYPTGGILSGLLGAQYLTAIVAMAWRRRQAISTASGGSWRDKLPHGLVPTLMATLMLMAVAVTWLVAFGSVAAGVFAVLTTYIGGPLHHPASLWWTLACIAALAALLSLADVTSLSLHPFYRRRLALAFAVRRRITRTVNGTSVEAEAYPPDEPTWLHTHGRIAGGPEFIFAAAAAISGEGKPAPGLNAVSYVLGANYIGGPISAGSRRRKSGRRVHLASGTTSRFKQP